MKRTSQSQKSWKERMVDQWVKLSHLYCQVQTAPTLRYCLKIGFGLCKMLFSIAMKRVLEDLFRDI